MDDEILREEGAGKAQKVAWVAFPVLLIGLIALRLSSIPGGTTTWLVVILVVVIGLTVGGTIIWATERATAFASRGPFSRGQVYTQAPPAVVTAALMDTLRRTGVIVEESNGMRVVGRKKASLMTWGTRVFVDLRPSANRPGLGVVTVAVRPSYPLQASEGGRGVKLATSLLSAVPGIVDVVAPGQARRG